MSSSNRRPKNRAFLWKMLLLLVAVLLNVTLISRILVSSYNWKILKDQHAQASQKLDVLTERQVALSREIRLLKTDPAYMEKIIRQRLKYLHENEVLYMFEQDAPSSIWTDPETDDKQ